MTGEVDLYGIFVPGLALATLAAFAVNAVMRRLLAGIGFYRLVWHRPLFDLALYVVILGGLVALAGLLST